MYVCLYVVIYYINVSVIMLRYKFLLVTYTSCSQVQSNIIHDLLISFMMILFVNLATSSVTIGSLHIQL